MLRGFRTNITARSQLMLGQGLFNQTTPVLLEQAYNFHNLPGTPLPQDVNPRNYSCLDFETTGTSPKKGVGITEVGVVKVRQGQIVDKFHTFVNPTCPVPAAITKMSGHTALMLSKYPTFAKVLPDLIAFIGQDPIVAHNAGFERRFLSYFCEQEAQSFNPFYYDSLGLMRRVFYKHFDSYALGALCQEFGFELDENEAYHNAIPDAKMTVKIWERMLDELHCNTRLSQPVSAAFLDTLQSTDTKKCAAILGHDEAKKKLPNLR